MSAPLATADLLLRGGAASLLLLVAGLLVRDVGRSAAARLGVVFALGSGAYALCAAAQVHAAFGPWTAPVLALASGNNVVLWLFALAVFDDGFRLRPGHGAVWAAVVAAAVLHAFVLPPAVARWLDLPLSLQAIGFAALAAVQALTSWRGDLVERRRALRLFVVAAASGHSLVMAGSRLAAGPTPPAGSLASALALFAIAAVVAVALMQVDDRDDLFGARPRPEPAGAPPALDAADRTLLAALERRMGAERAYREEGLTIGRLAASLDVPEHRLRRLVNRGLGHRNFAAFVNGYRLDEAKAALADPAQAEVPVLTIAIDAGFGSLGPFNRAFKAGTGRTPTEYRRAALADFEHGSPISKTGEKRTAIRA